MMTLTACTEAILKARAQRIAATQTVVADQDDHDQYLTFTLGGLDCAVALSRLAGVAERPVHTPIPGAPSSLLGIGSVRGQICPLINLHALLERPMPADNAGRYLALVRAGSRPVGLCLDAFSSVRRIDPACLTVPDSTINGLPQRFVAGLTPDTLVILDVEQILMIDVLRAASVQSPGTV